LKPWACLDREVKTSKIVLGLWSPAALSRPWVQIECDIGKRRGVLIPVAIKPFRDMDVPAPFWNIQFVDLTEGLHNTDDPNWTKLHRSIARTLNRPDLVPKTTATAPGGFREPTPSRTGPQSAHKAPSTGSPWPGVTVVAIILLAGGGGAFWYLDPMGYGWRTLETQTAVTSDALSAAPAAPVTSAATLAPNPIVLPILGKWVAAGLDCEESAETISATGDQLTHDYGGSLAAETIEGAEPDGSIRTRANGGSFFYSLKDGTLTLRPAIGAPTTFTRCGD
jgi:hypothetical protein